jgi:hypothetical protein
MGASIPPPGNQLVHEQLFLFDAPVLRPVRPRWLHADTEIENRETLPIPFAARNGGVVYRWNTFDDFLLDVDINDWGTEIGRFPGTQPSKL